MASPLCVIFFSFVMIPQVVPKSTLSASSTTKEEKRFLNISCTLILSSNLKPKPLPICILKIASATLFAPSAYAERILPSRIKVVMLSNILISESVFGRLYSSYSGEIKATLWFSFLNSGVTMLSMCSQLTANDTKVGGTLMFSNVPLIESLPPIAAI